MHKYPVFYLFLILLFLNIGVVNGQDLKTQEGELTALFEKLKSAPNDLAADSINTKILASVRKFIETEKSYDYDFKSLKQVGGLRSDDQKLRIYAWSILRTDGKYAYFGYLQYYVKKQKSYVIHPLVDKSDEIENPGYASLTPDRWYGALYYKILSKKYKKQRTYTLLAWDGNDNFTNKKIIETLSFDKEGNAEFGLPILNYEKTVQKRLVFEYAEQAKMLLRYDDAQRMIVWDHLAPSKPELKGQYLFYGPDSSYDGLYYNKGVWDFYPKLNLKNASGENPEDRPGKSNKLIK